MGFLETAEIQNSSAGGTLPSHLEKSDIREVSQERKGLFASNQRGHLNHTREPSVIAGTGKKDFQGPEESSVIMRTANWSTSWNPAANQLPQLALREAEDDVCSVRSQGDDEA